MLAEVVFEDLVSNFFSINLTLASH